MKHFYLCSICDHYHPKGCEGECRDNANRFTLETLPADWQEVAEPDWEAIDQAVAAAVRKEREAVVAALWPKKRE